MSTMLLNISRILLWGSAPAYFVIGWLLVKTEWLKDREIEGTIETRIWVKLVFTVLTILMVAGIAKGLVDFYEICSPFISKSFLKISIGGFYSARFVWLSTFVFSMDLNILLEIFECVFVDIYIWYLKFIGFLKWIAQHVMNVIAVMALYYVVHNGNSYKGNAFLLTFASFVALEWFTRDVFELLSKNLHIEGYISRIIYGVKKTENIV